MEKGDLTLFDFTNIVIPSASGVLAPIDLDLEAIDDFAGSKIISRFSSESKCHVKPKKES